MRAFGVCLILSLSAPVAVAAQDYDCDRSAAIVEEAVEARRSGTPIETAQADLSARLDPEAGALLAEYIYALPEEQLTDEVSAAWRQICAGL